MTDIERSLQAIREDCSRGANQLATDGIDLLVASAQPVPGPKPLEVLKDVQDLAARLLTVRPSMAVISNSALYCWLELSARPGEVAAISAELAVRRQTDQAALVVAASAALNGARTVLTLSYSSTVERILSGTRGVERVIIGEGRPRFEGWRLAEALENKVAKVDLITDAELSYFAQRVDYLIFGADSITSDFAVINKIGSHATALCAESAGLPCLVAADSSKLDPVHTAETIRLEEMAPEEVWPARPELCRNIYFEPVPARLISAYATEKGVRQSEDLAFELDQWRALHAKFRSPRGD